MCNFNSAGSPHRNKGDLEKVLYPEGSQRASQKLHKSQAKSLLADPQGELIATTVLSHTTPPHVNERFTHMSEKWNLESKPVVGPEEGNFAPNTYSNCSLPILGIRNDSCLTDTHRRGTPGSMLRVKHNTAIPTGKLHGEVRHKELEFGGLPFLPNVPQAQI